MNIIAALRKKGEYSQLDIANSATNISGEKWTAQRISHYETGRRTPRLKDVKLLVKAFNKLGINCSVEELYPDTEQPQKAA